MDLVSHVIDGAPTQGAGTRRSEVFDPVGGHVARHVVLGCAADVDRAVVAARQAFPAWAATPPLARARVMFRLRNLIERDAERLAGIVTDEHGKIASDSLGEITRGLEVVEYATGIPELLKGDFTEQAGRGIDAYTMRQPLGVVAGITPFNFPVMVPLWMMPMAIATGNCFILKPSERDPSASIVLAELLAEAGLPSGVFQVVQGDKEVVDAILAHPGIAAVSFVGSTPVARAIQAAGIAHGKRVQALGGAKNHAIVMPDCDLDHAVDALMGAAYGSAGERCMAISVAVAVGGIADDLVAALAARVRALRIGPGRDPDSEMGPLVTATHRDKVRAMIADGVEDGADLVVDGRDHRCPGHAGGFFIGGCLFDNVAPGSRTHAVEIFGPVLAIIRVPDFAAALEVVNSHAYGNGTAIFTRDGATARQFVRGVEVGMVGVNVPIPVPMAFHSFGGWKASMFGDHHMHGPEGVRFYTRLKAVTARWPEGTAPGAEFKMPTLG